MNKQKEVLVLGLMLFALVFSACSLGGEAVQPLNQETIAVFARQTLEAIQTQDASNITPTFTSAPATETAVPTSTLAPSSTPVSTETPFATITPLPTFTPFPTITPLPSITPGGSNTSGGSSGGSSGGGVVATPQICNWAQLVDDVTIPDGTILNPGAYFTKVWRVKNIGTCTWTTGYEFRHVDGERFGAKKSISLPKKVAPGQTVDISLDMLAPEDRGSYEGGWMLVSAQDSLFGIGAGARSTLTVSVEVSKQDRGIVYDFVTNFCAAEWESEAGDLPCPGREGDEDGFVLRLSNPSLESRNENEPALWTQPQRSNDGWIRGTYPNIQISSGDRFLADIGCLAGYERCDVLFQLRYRVNGGDEKKFDGWNEVYDGKTTRLDIDLSQFSGDKLQIIFYVRANGSARDDAAFWLVPQIKR